MKNTSFTIFGLIIFITTLNISCKKEELSKDEFPMKIEFSFFTPDLKIERSGGREHGSFSFDKRWKMDPVEEDSTMVIIFSFMLNPVQPRHVMVFYSRIWYNGQAISLNERINPNTNFMGLGNKDYSFYYNEYDATAAHWDLDPNYDNYIMLTHLSDDKKVIEGEFSFRGIKRPEYITMPYIPADTMTYEGGKFRMEKLF